MATAIQKIALSASRDIPFNKLLLSSCNVRRVKASVSIEQLADDIARRTLLQSLTVRPVLDADGVETGMYEIPAGGRRFRALELLVKQKRLAKNAAIPCVIRIDGIAEEDSLAENVQRAPLHPLDQFRAFLALREKGQSEEEIATVFFVAVSVVKQRLRLASVSPNLLDAYADDAMTLEQLMAFAVAGDHERQEQVWERLQASHSREPFAIRRMLTEGAVRASDKRARFIGEAYEAAGGTVMRDLFQGDDGGWLQDVALVNRLVAEQLEREAEAVRAEGWHWIEVAPDFPYGHQFGLRQLRGDQVPLTTEQGEHRDALQVEYDWLEETHADIEELPEEVDRRLAEIEAELEAIDERPAAFDPAEITRAGAFVSIDGNGRLQIERGYVRPEDELPANPEPDLETGAEVVHQFDGSGPTAANDLEADADSKSVYAGSQESSEPEEDEGIKPLPDRLMSELTAHRTLALRYAIGERPDIAFLAALHALSLNVFYSYRQETCLELELKQIAFTAQAPGLSETAPAKAVGDRHQCWLASLPREPENLWTALAALDQESQRFLFAHCVSCSVNALHESWNRRPRQMAHAGKLAQAVDLDMAATGWTPTVENYLGRVTKARIVQAVSEAKGDRAAESIGSLKKYDMAEKAQEMLTGAGWLAEPLRTPGRDLPQPTELAEQNTETDAAGEEMAAAGCETDMRKDDAPSEDEPVAGDEQAIAAE